MCDHTGWFVGHAFTRSEGSGELISDPESWRLPADLAAAAFATATDRTSFGPGVGLPGRTVATCQPSWIQDIATDDNFPRQAAALDAGFRAAAAFPVVVRAEVRAVLEFFSPVVAPPDETLMRVMNHMSHQLGRVFEREDAEARLSHQALHDDLTGLPNRALLRDRLSHALERAQRQANCVDLVFLDVDDFKTINDGLGHHAGDAALVEIAARLSRCVRTTDTVSRAGVPTVARLAGDEFAILLEDCDRPELVAERILGALASPVVTDDGEIFIGVSMGIARVADAPGGAEPLLRAADVAMHVAKRRGKGRYELYEPSMHDAVRDRHELGVELRRAVAEEQLVLLYQPEISLATGQVVGAEALIRWQHPRLGVVAPDQFIPLAEETGVIVEIGEWVLGEACRAAVRWSAPTCGADPLTIAVNVSGRQLRDEGFVDVVRRALAASGLPGERLCCEITESVLMEDPDAAVRTLVEVRRLGATIAVDDFGTGYSSLAALKRYPVDYLKIDRSFVRGLPGDVDDSQIVRAVIRLGQNLSLRVIAEGVEDRSQLEALREYGCDLAQGYLFGRPGPESRIMELLLADAW